MKIHWWEFWKFKEAFKQQDDVWKDRCACLCEEINYLVKNQVINIYTNDALKETNSRLTDELAHVKDDLKALKNAYFQKVKENRNLEGLLNPKRDVPGKRCKKG